MGINEIKRQLEELQLINFSLLPDEELRFIDGNSGWSEALEAYSVEPSSIPQLESTASFGIRLNGAKVWFEVTFSDTDGQMGAISVKGEDMSRSQQDKWHSSIAEKMEEISDSECVSYTHSYDIYDR